MDNLRKRVGELQLDKNWKRLPREKEKEKEQIEESEEEEKPLLKVGKCFIFMISMVGGKMIKNKQHAITKQLKKVVL